MRVSMRTWTTWAVTAAAAMALVVLAAACGNAVNAGAATNSPSASPSAKTAITTNWEKFFSGTTPAAQKIELLQNGQQFAQVIKAQAGSTIAQATQAKVTSVTMTSPTTADVTYSIVQGGQTVLPNQKGQAVKVGGVWQVSARSFEDLLKLEQGQTGGQTGASPAAP